MTGPHESEGPGAWNGRCPVPRSYEVYGLCVRSHWPLPFPGARPMAPPEIELCEGPAARFAAACRAAAREVPERAWFHHARLPDGSDYLRWSGLFEFLVSADGRRIEGRPLNGTPREAFHAYLLGQVLSFALLKRGIEPLHATAVVIGGEAVGFVGDCGQGKSSLAAAFLREGHGLLTDDLLVVKEGPSGFLAYPGPPRIKLFPAIATRLFGKRVAGVPMNRFTPKLVIPLGREKTMCWGRPSPLKALYVLTPPFGRRDGDRITIRSLSPRRACVALLRSTFNAMVVEPARLQRQLDLASRMAGAIPIRSLAYPRRLGRLSAVRAAILSDLTA